MKVAEYQENVVFLQIGISRMGDKRGVSSEEIEVDADKELVKVRKVIFKSPYFDRIKSLDAEIRRYVRSQCFPFESGLHLAALKMVETIDQKLNQYHHQRYQYILDFAEVFPRLASEFDEKLRKLYNSKDYDVGDVSSQFSMYWNFIQLVTPSTLPPSAFNAERRKLEARMNEAFEEARMILRETCLSMVTHLRESLANDVHGAPKRITSSTVTKLQEFVNTFNLRNITNDETLEGYINQLKNITRGADAESLRTMEGYRMRMNYELSSIEQALQESVEIAPTRRIRGF